MELLAIVIIVVLVTGAYYKLLFPMGALFLGIMFDNVLLGIVGMVACYIFLCIIPTPEGLGDDEDDDTNRKKNI